MNPTQQLKHHLELLASKEKKQRRSTLLYLGLPLLAGVLLTSWSIRQAWILNEQQLELSVKNEELRVLRGKVDEQTRLLQNTSEQSNVMRKGLMKLQSRKYDEAIREFDKAIELDPTNPNAYSLKGYAQLRKKAVPAAIATLKQSIEVDPQHTWGHYNLALAYWSSGDQTKAVEEVRKVLDIEPEFRETFKLDVQFEEFRKSSQEYREMIDGDGNRKPGDLRVR